MLTVGDLLKKQRLSKNISLSQVEKSIKVRGKFLKAIEDNDWAFFSSKIYIIGIIKSYAKFLNLDQNKLIAFFRREYERKENIEFKRKVTSKYLSSETRKMVFLGLGLIIALFALYFGYQLKAYFSPPKVSILSPKQTSTSDDKIKIIGQTEKEAVITIFGERVFQDKTGRFEYTFPLKDGKNELTIEITGGNGKTTILKKDFYKKQLN